MAATSRAGPPADPRAGSAAGAEEDSADAGMVTVEAAIGIGTFVLVLLLALAGVAMVLAQIRCTDAAREVARLVARGEADRAGDAVRRIAPSGASFTVRSVGDSIVVEVSDDPANGLLPGARVVASAYAVREPDATDADEPTAGPPGAGGDRSDDPAPRAGSRPTGGDGR